jgi:hypothetical protein
MYAVYETFNAQFNKSESFSVASSSESIFTGHAVLSLKSALTVGRHLSHYVKDSTGALQILLSTNLIIDHQWKEKQKQKKTASGYHLVQKKKTAADPGFSNREGGFVWSNTRWNEEAIGAPHPVRIEGHPTDTV